MFCDNHLDDRVQGKKDEQSPCAKGDQTGAGCIDAAHFDVERGATEEKTDQDQKKALEKLTGLHER